MCLNEFCFKHVQTCNARDQENRVFPQGKQYRITRNNTGITGMPHGMENSKVIVSNQLGYLNLRGVPKNV
jgi:hypothetical protein